MEPKLYLWVTEILIEARLSQFTCNITIINESEKNFKPRKFLRTQSFSALQYFTRRNTLPNYKLQVKADPQLNGAQGVIKAKGLQESINHAEFFSREKNQPHGFKMEKSLARNFHEL